MTFTDNFDLVAIGNRIRRRRKQKKWTRKYMSSLTGLSLTTIRRTESGYNFEISTLDRISKGLEVDVAYLLYGRPAEIEMTQDISRFIELFGSEISFHTIHRIMRFVEKLAEERLQNAGYFEGRVVSPMNSD